MDLNDFDNLDILSDYDEKCDRIRANNEKYLELFEKELLDGGLKEKTVHRHLSNVDFYINTFLLYEEPLTMEHGLTMISLYLGEYFIRKCMWSTPASIKSTAASIKKFYKCMVNNGIVDKVEYDSLCSEIKDEMESWQEYCAIYNDPSQPNPFMFF